MFVALPLLIIIGVYSIGWLFHTNLDTLKRQNWWDICVSACLVGALFSCSILLIATLAKF